MIVGLLGVIAALLIGLVFVLVTRDDESGDEAGTTSNTLATTAASAPTSATTAAPTTAAPTTAAPSGAACTAAAIDPVVRASLGGPGAPEIAEVLLAECAGGYARAFAVPVAENIETEQVFLEDLDGSWEYLTSGTGIDCNDQAGLWPELIAACEALGLEAA